MNENQVQLKNPVTNEIKTVKIGWSWTCFLFSWFYGIPLFLRGLNIWGGVMLFITLESYLIVIGAETLEKYWAEAGFESLAGYIEDIMLLVALFAFGVWFGIRANLMAIRNYLEKGWYFVDSENVTVKRIKGNLNMLDE